MGAPIVCQNTIDIKYSIFCARLKEYRFKPKKSWHTKKGVRSALNSCISVINLFLENKKTNKSHPTNRRQKPQEKCMKTDTGYERSTAHAQVSSCPRVAELVILLKTLTCAKTACLNVHSIREKDSQLMRRVWKDLSTYTHSHIISITRTH